MSSRLARSVKSGIRYCLSTLGYEVRRRSTAHVWGSDPYRDQVELVRSRPVQTIFDVGANVGDTVAAYRRLFPGATIHAFEPFPEAFQALRANFAQCPQVLAHQCAVAERSATVQFHVNEASVTNSLFPVDPRSTAFVDAAMTSAKGSIEVAAVPLDDFCCRMGIDTVDILKMDIQGGEGRALEGAARLLAERRIRMIYSEVLFAPLYQEQVTFSQLTAQLERCGYQLFALYELKTMAAGLAWADAIFCPVEAGVRNGQ